MARCAAVALTVASLLLSASCSKKQKEAGIRSEAPPRAAEHAARASAPEELAVQVYAEKPIKDCDVLLSGYEPFAGYPFNSSWETVASLDGETVGGKKVRAVLLPVVWGEASKKLARAVDAARPEIALAFGMGTPTLRIELAAWNERAPHPDNLGRLPPAEVVEEGGPEELHTTLPVNEIAAALARLGVKFTLSTDAGGYLCNEAFYSLMRQRVRCAGFVHVPVARPGTAELEDLKHAVRAIVEACIGGEKP